VRVSASLAPTLAEFSHVCFTLHEEPAAREEVLMDFGIVNLLRM
jgi:hypothetical protein